MIVPAHQAGTVFIKQSTRRHQPLQSAPMSAPLELLDLLADGRLHSGAVLGRVLGIAPSTVRKRVQALRDMGIEIHAARGRGYRLTSPIERLDADLIRQALPAERRHQSTSITVLAQVDSTNLWLAENSQRAPNGSICVAEQQMAGRGRAKRVWVSPFGRNIYFSMLWRLPTRVVPGLSLAMGVCVAEACEAIAGKGVSKWPIALKWPNDVIVMREGLAHKLAGILIELSTANDGSSRVIIGVGLNLDLPRSVREAIDQPVIDLHELYSERVARNALVATLMERMMVALPRYELEGLAPFRARYLAREANLDREISINQGGRVSTGVARGIDAQGALLVETSEGLTPLLSGDVSMRAAI